MPKMFDKRLFWCYHSRSVIRLIMVINAFNSKKSIKMEMKSTFLLKEEEQRFGVKVFVKKPKAK